MPRHHKRAGGRGNDNDNTLVVTVNAAFGNSGELLYRVDKHGCKMLEVVI